MTIDELKILIEYSPETGALRWRERGRWVVDRGFQTDLGRRKFNAKYAGALCFTGVDKDGYLQGNVFRRFYRAHRVAYAIYHGEWPLDTIDHINRDRTDNRIANLRDATMSQQMANRGRQKNNTSGCTGVHFNSKGKKWVARKHVDGIRIYLGVFETKLAAIEAIREWNDDKCR